jgi:putative heme iron utilization protein
MLENELPVIAALLRSARHAALGTLDGAAPFVSMVAYAPEPDLAGYLLHLSGLSAHTRHLRADPRASLLVCERDDGREDVQTLARITVTGAAQHIPRGSVGHGDARERYLARLPASAMLFDFPDFELFRLVADGARYVGGFARAYTLTVEHLRKAAE